MWRATCDQVCAGVVSVLKARMNAVVIMEASLALLISMHRVYMYSLLYVQATRSWSGMVVTCGAEALMKSMTLYLSPNTSHRLSLLYNDPYGNSVV
jgi:hypothetical protein